MLMPLSSRDKTAAAQCGSVGRDKPILATISRLPCPDLSLTDRQTEKITDIQTDTWRNRQTDRWRNRHTGDRER